MERYYLKLIPPLKKANTRFGLQTGNKGLGQVSIEITLGLICMLILLIGVTRLFVWLNQSLIERQEAYVKIRQTGQLIYTPKYAVNPINGEKVLSVDEQGNLRITETSQPRVSFYKPERFYIFSKEKLEGKK